MIATRRGLASIRRNFLTGVSTFLLVVLVVLSMGRGNQVSELRVLVASYEQDLVRWEVTHFMDKWVHRTADFVLHRPSGERRREEAVEQFFALRDDLREARDQLDRTVARADADPGEAQTRVLAIVRERASLAGIVEEALESTLSGVLDDQGIIGGVWALKWPPVDFAFEADWLVLVRSPRERIERLSDVLLEPGVSVLDRIALEDEVESANPLHSALVVRVGGVATYPAKVTLEASLHGTLYVASHEWLHHWLIFRPLGRRVLSGGELSSINETVADIFAEEIGDLALTRLTGEVFPRPPWEPPTLRHVEEPPDDVFDFTREMRGTRLRLEELLDEGQVEAAEAFLEERRLEFVANGFNIHKLNTAWFAYNGTYAGRAESISPIEGQLRAIRADAGSLSEFLDRVSGIDREGELERLAREADWEPTPLVTSDG